MDEYKTNLLCPHCQKTTVVEMVDRGGIRRDALLQVKWPGSSLGGAYPSGGCREYRCTSCGHVFLRSYDH